MLHGTNMRLPLIILLIQVCCYSKEASFILVQTRSNGCVLKEAKRSANSNDLQYSSFLQNFTSGRSSYLEGPARLEYKSTCP